MPTTLAITPASPSVDMGGTVTLQLQANGQAQTTDVTWSLDSNDHATIDGSGLATGVSAGTVTVTATYQGTSTSTTLTVLAPTQIVILPVPTLDKGQSYQPVAMGTFDDGGTCMLSDGVTWSSEDTGVASVGGSEGTIAAKEAGVTTIHATYGSVTGSVAVGVVEQEAQEITSTATRYRIDVPSPKVQLSLGEPASDFGYTGFSLHADDGFFADISRTAQVQVGAAITWQTSRQWQQYSSQDTVISSGAGGTLATKRLLVAAAGAGYAENPQPQTGELPASIAFNADDLNSLLEPIAGAEGLKDKGLRGVEKHVEEAMEELEIKLGYKDPPKPKKGQPVPPGPQAVLSMQALLKLMMGDLGEAEGNSEWVEQFMERAEGVLGYLRLVTRSLDKLDKFLARPETLPVAGPFLAKGKQLKTILLSMDDTYRALGLELGREKSMPSYDKDTGTGAYKGKAPTGEKGLLAAAGFLGSDLAKSISPARNFVRDLNEAAHSIDEIVDGLGQLLGILAPPPSAAGIIAKDGISLLTQDRLVAFAPDGMHMVSGEKANLEDVDLFGLAFKKLEDATIGKLAGDSWLRSFLLGRKLPRPNPQKPGFWFTTTGPFVTQATGEVSLAASTSATVRADEVGEVVAAGPVGLFSRTEGVEVAGKEVAIGMPIDAELKKALPTTKTAQDAIRAPIAALKAQRDALDATITTLDEKVTALEEHSFDEVTAQRQALRTMGFISAARHGSTADAIHPVVMALLEQKKVLREARKAVDDLIATQEQAAQKAGQAALPPFTSKVFEKLNPRKPNQKKKKTKKKTKKPNENDAQVRPEKITIGSVGEIEAYGLGKVSVTSQEGIEIERVGLEEIPSSLKLGLGKATIEAGAAPAAFSIEVSQTGVTIKSSAGTTSLKLDATGIELKQGSTSAKLTAVGLELKVGGQSITLSPAAIQLG